MLSNRSNAEKYKNAVRTFQKCIGDAVGKKGLPDAGAAVKNRFWKQESKSCTKFQAVS